MSESVSQYVSQQVSKTVSKSQAAERCLPGPDMMIKPFLKGNFEVLEKHAAMQGFWTLDKVVLDKIVNASTYRVPKGADLYTQLWHMVEKTLDCSDSEALDFLFLRVANLHKATKFTQEVYCMEDAMECLEETDKRVLASEQEKAPDMLAASRDFSQRHQAKARTHYKRADKKRTAKSARTKTLLKDLF